VYLTIFFFIASPLFGLGSSGGDNANHLDLNSILKFIPDCVRDDQHG